MKLADAVAALEDLVPLRFAEGWDNVGLLLGDPAQDVARAMFCVDLTPAVLAEAESSRCELVVAYHPPIFEALKRVTAGSIAHDALKRGIACWSPHTALDVAAGGTSDVLAEALGLRDPEPLRVAPPAPVECKLVTFVPEDHLQAVSDAIFEAGAGRIGQYQSCSFRMPGTGTFFGGEKTNPAVGEKGRLEQVPEIRLETVLPLKLVPQVVAALRRTHPYEEPAFDLVGLQAHPEPRGMGRIGDLAQPDDRAEILSRVKSALSVATLLVAGPTKGVVTRAACGPGSCGDLWKDAASRGAELFLTGEMRHHEALAASARGMTIACALHSNSERAALPRLAASLHAKLPALATLVSAADRDPFGFL